MKRVVWMILSVLILAGCNGGVSEELYDTETLKETSVREVTSEIESVTKEAETQVAVEEKSAEPYQPTEDMYNYKDGPLQVEGSQLLDKNGDVIQLRGISTHGVHYQGSLINAGSFGTLVNDWNVKLIRGAMYVEEDGYSTNPDYSLKKLEDVVMLSTYYGIYTIVDWHVHYDQDPLKHVELAEEFFGYISSKYADNENILYEICNEPNGDQVTWDKNIKPYAERIIPIIRANDPDAVIIVGTGSWSQDLPDAADNPLDFDNVMYTCHFYAGSHGQELRDNIQYTLDRDLAVFVTEWGTSLNTGDGGVYKEEADVWLDYLDSHMISWANWSLAALPESSSLLIPGPLTKAGGNWPDDRISESGHYIRERLLSYD